MKKKVTALAVILVAGLTACKKDRVCECTSSSSYTFVNSQGQAQTTTNPASTQKTEYKKVKKSDIRVNCSDSEYSTSSSTPNGTSTSSGETKCKLL